MLKAWCTAQSHCLVVDGNVVCDTAKLFILICRRYFFLITYRSYLYCSSPRETAFASWMEARPELGHLCDNLRLDR